MAGEDRSRWVKRGQPVDSDGARGCFELAIRIIQYPRTRPCRQSTSTRTMGIVSYTLTWGAIGFGIRCYQLGIMRRPIFTNLWGHGISVAFFGSLGYYFHGLKIRQRELLEQKRQELAQFQEAQKIRLDLRNQKFQELLH
ncbi:hypothetical protein O181_027970 [Austropuccinia psidii MF-1]|uniref:Uncharacterized protein n=1 Tax=Austropuccinia psidii MF-1 TaxID=1389203 RepID=A0A9Q3CSD5_9BASI|nr:hypothetical protein [Austropuccinia psidii MF-1]